MHFDARHHGGEVVHHQDAKVHEEQAAAEETICEALSFSYCVVARGMIPMPTQLTQKLLSLTCRRLWWMLMVIVCIGRHLG